MSEKKLSEKPVWPGQEFRKSLLCNWWYLVIFVGVKGSSKGKSTIDYQARSPRSGAGIFGEEKVVPFKKDFLTLVLRQERSHFSE